MMKTASILFIVMLLSCISWGDDLTDYSKIDLLVRIRSPKLIYDFEVVNDISNFRLLSERNKQSQFLPAKDFIQTSIPWARWCEIDPIASKKIKKLLKEKEYFMTLTISPDKKWVAISVGSSNCRLQRQTEVALIDAKQIKEMLRMKLPEGRYIGDLAWKADSQTLFVLEQSERVGLNPLALISAFAGHPVPYLNFYVGIIEPNSGKVSESENAFLENVKYASGWFMRNRSSWVQ